MRMRRRDMKQMNQKFLATIICVVQCPINMFNLQASFMTIYHHNVMKGENGGERIPATVKPLIMDPPKSGQPL